MMETLSCKMAELRYEAPLATFDLDEWNEFLDGDGDDDAISGGSIVVEPDDYPATTTKAGGGRGAPAVVETGDGSFGETFSGSLEDLVNTFDDKIIKCFRNYSEQADSIAPVQVRTQDDVTEDAQTWWTLTGNFGGILPIDWSQLYTPSAVETETNAEQDTDGQSTDGEEMCEDDDQEDLTPDEELSIAPEEEPVETADDVISEIEGMLEDGVSTDKSSSKVRHDRQNRRKRANHTISKLEDKSNLKNLPLSGLGELSEELDCNIRDLSEVLIEELAARDELEYEKELKNQFIWLLLTVQKRRRELVLEMSYRQQTKVLGNGYLTTVIPYQASHDPLTIEKLQIYIKILSAINEDHCSVPALLTDYILRVLCPTT